MGEGLPSLAVADASELGAGSERVLGGSTVLIAPGFDGTSEILLEDTVSGSIGGIPLLTLVTGA